MRIFAKLLLAGLMFFAPSEAQHGGRGFHGSVDGGFHGGGFAGSGFHGGFVHGGYRGGWYYPGNHFVFRFGYPYGPYSYGPYLYGPYYGVGWAYPYYYSYYPYSSYWYPNANSYPEIRYGYSGADPSACPRMNGKSIYQIKLTYQNNIWLAQDYWYNDDTLNFVTMEGEQNKTPISSMDRAITLRLNRNCGVDFQLPR